ncbi:uncharacterized protein LOC131605602 [Vicia villosa]|uniref:uncharacterized protein LOC131605602 n=1 Tax=Vicia villosa TaxID=3911 RepID=UPI00273CDA47|nr:uncharacterized protein LOC131605602 [Vicia villosa]
MASVKYEVEKFASQNEFGFEEASRGETALDVKLEEKEKKILMGKAHSAIILSLRDKALTSLKLKAYPTSLYVSTEILLPKSLNLPALTRLDLTYFAFCGGENSCIEPFLAFTKLNTLVLRNCKILSLVPNLLEVKLLSLCNLKSLEVELVPLHNGSLLLLMKDAMLKKAAAESASDSELATAASPNEKVIVLLFCYTQVVNFFAVTTDSVAFSAFWMILSLVPGLFEVKLASLSNLKFMEIKLESDSHQMGLPYMVKDAMLKKATAKSRKEAAKLRKAFKAGLQPTPIPDGVVDFLLQNSPSAKVDIKNN